MINNIYLYKNNNNCILLGVLFTEKLIFLKVGFKLNLELNREKYCIKLGALFKVNIAHA